MYDVGMHPVKGRCLVASIPITAGTVIQKAPTIKIDRRECDLLDGTSLYQYYFRYPRGAHHKDYHGLLVLGVVHLCNHSEDPNAEFVFEDGGAVCVLRALKDIPAGMEICTHYGDYELWFDRCEDKLGESHAAWNSNYDGGRGSPVRVGDQLHQGVSSPLRDMTKSSSLLSGN